MAPIRAGAAIGPDEGGGRTLAEQDLLVAMSLCQMGEWDKAQGLLKKANRKDPSSTTIYIRMVRLNNLLKALENPSSKTQKEFLGNGSEAKLLLDGVRLHVEGRSSEAMTLLRYVQLTRRHDERVNNLIRHVISAGGLDAPSELEDPEKEIKRKLKMTAELFDGKRYEEALEVCKQLVQLAPDLEIVRTRLGSIYFALGDKASAKKEYDNALSLNPNDEVLRDFMRAQGWRE